MRAPGFPSLSIGGFHGRTRTALARSWRHTQHRKYGHWVPVSHSSLCRHMHCIIFSSASVNSSPPSATYMRRWIGSALVQVMAWRLFGAKPLPELMLPYCQLDPWEQLQWNSNRNMKKNHSSKCVWMCRLRNGGHFVQGEIDQNVMCFIRQLLARCRFGVVRSLWNLAGGLLITFSSPSHFKPVQD